MVTLFVVVLFWFVFMMAWFMFKAQSTGVRGGALASNVVLTIVRNDYSGRIVPMLNSNDSVFMRSTRWGAERLSQETIL